MIFNGKGPERQKIDKMKLFELRYQKLVFGSCRERERERERERREKERERDREGGREREIVTSNTRTSELPKVFLVWLMATVMGVPCVMQINL